MGLSSVAFFDARSEVSSAPTICPSTSSDTSVSECSSDISTAATTLAGDVSVSEKLDSLRVQSHQHAEPLHLTTRVPPQPQSHSGQPTLEIQNEDPIHSAPTVNSRRDSSASDSLTLEDALLWRPLHVLPHTPPPPKFSMDTPFDTASLRPTFSHIRAFQSQCIDVPVRVFVKEDPGPRWPYIYGYGIDPSRVNPNKDLPALPTNSKQSKGKRGWRAIRRRVSHLLQCHSKEKGIQENVPPASPVASDHATPSRPLKISKSTTLNLKPSSASLLSPRPQMPSSSSKALPSGSTAPIVCTNQHSAYTYVRKQQLRRSHSFSGYPTMLASIADEKPPAPPLDNYKEPMYTVGEDEKEMDDRACEGSVILWEVAKAWNIEPLVLDDDCGGDDNGNMNDNGNMDDNGDMDEVEKEAFEMLEEVQKTWRFAPLNEDDPAFKSGGRDDRGVRRR